VSALITWLTVGTIELPLDCALKADPTDRAGDYMRNGRNPQDKLGAELYDIRTECYRIVTDALKEYDDELNQATADGNGE
jgi:nuclear pore complex protein Nup155